MSPPASKNNSIQPVFSILLTIYSNTVKKTLVKGKMPMKEVKSIKTKELLFTLDDSESNYIKFLKAILLKHGLEKL